MIHNKLFQECLAAVPEERKAEFELSFAIADRIAEVLRQKGMTQRDLAQKLGKRESEISKWLTGRHNFTTSTIARIALALDAQIINVTSTRYDTCENEVMTNNVAEESTRSLPPLTRLSH